MIKGCIFELSYEFDLYRDLVRNVIEGDYKDQLINKITSELLNAHIEYVLNNRLSDYYRTPMDIMSIISDVLDLGFNGCVNIKKLYKSEDDIEEITRILDSRLFEIFRNVDVNYALWRTSKVTSFVKCVEYLGDYRIMEWHERAGIPYQGETKDVSFEFSLSSLYTVISTQLTPYFGKYAGKMANNYIDIIIRNLIEESIFLNGNRKIDDPNSYIKSSLEDNVIISDYPYTRERIKSIFEMIEDTDIQRVITEGVIVIENELLNTIRAIINLDDVRSYFINDKILTVVVERPMSKIDFGDRLKVDIKTSIDNGDWIPPKLRRMVDL